MLYNPSWSYEFTLSNLIAWLKTKPAEEEYCFYDNGMCLLGQWAKSVDPTAEAVEEIDANSFTYRVNGRHVDFVPFDGPARPNEQPLYNITSNKPHTFGAALERAKAYAEDAKASTNVPVFERA